MSVKDRLRGTVELRRFATEGVELRSTGDGGLRFMGYAAVTETPYPVGGFTETFAKGAFRRCLGEDPDVVLLINHEGLPLARTKSGTMTLTEDARGLKVDADLDPDDPDVRALVPKMRRGDLTEMSFAFRATDDEWSDRDTKRLVRSATIHKGDVSVVTHGANSATSAGVRSMVEELESRLGRCDSKQDRAEIEASIRKLQGMVGSRSVPDLRVGFELARAQRLRRGRGIVLPATPVAARKGVVEVQRARRARHWRWAREAREKQRYTAAEIQALGEKGLAHPKRDGSGYHFPIVDAQDVAAAITDYGRAKPSEREAVREWIRKRAQKLDVWKLLPEKWKDE